MRVLYVEDSEPDAYFARQRWPEVHFIVVESIQEAGEWLDANGTAGLQAVLLDLHLPDSAGCDTAERMRRLAPSLPIVTLSGSSCNCSAADAQINKNEPGDLLAMIGEALERRRAGLTADQAVDAIGLRIDRLIGRLHRG